MKLGLAGKTAVVGGASKGLGRAAAMSLAREGARVVITARTAEVLSNTAKELSRATGSEVTARAADLSDPKQARSLMKEVIAAQGGVDILVNNAGGPPPGTFSDFDISDWEEAFRLNFLSAVAMTREAVPGMKERGWGRIINITSISVKQPLDEMILSNAVRAGVHGWAKSLSNELAPFGITVNNILPGFILTDRVMQLADDKAEATGASREDILRAFAANIPMKRIGKPEDLGDLAAFLASKQAGYITGASIQIDGGFFKGLM